MKSSGTAPTTSPHGSGPCRFRAEREESWQPDARILGLDSTWAEPRLGAASLRPTARRPHQSCGEAAAASRMSQCVRWQWCECRARPWSWWKPGLLAAGLQRESWECASACSVLWISDFTRPWHLPSPMSELSTASERLNSSQPSGSDSCGEPG